MVTKVERVGFILLGILIVGGFVFWKDARTLISGKTMQQQQLVLQEDKKKKKSKDKSSNKAIASKEISVTKKWELPSSLKEISGIAIIDEKKLACVQDELGAIFIFDRESGKVEEEIAFGKPGDYEGIAVVGNTAYIQRADGRLFEVADYASGKSFVKEYATPLTVKQNVEGLAYDKKNNRLLMAIKDKEPNSDAYKGIYAFDLSSKEMANEPVIKINLSDEVFNDVKKKNKIQPSDLEVHPATGDIYIVDGADPKLLVMNAEGVKKNLYTLSGDEFSQPEGIAITKEGDFFISNEGKTGAGNILEVTIAENQ